MSQTDPSQSIESPCNGICDIDWMRQLCRGCLRDLNEIGSWNEYTDEKKRLVLERVAERRAAEGE